MPIDMARQAELAAMGLNSGQIRMAIERYKHNHVYLFTKMERIQLSSMIKKISDALIGHEAIMAFEESIQRGQPDFGEKDRLSEYLTFKEFSAALVSPEERVNKEVLEFFQTSLQELLAGKRLPLKTIDELDLLLSRVGQHCSRECRRMFGRKSLILAR